MTSVIEQQVLHALFCLSRDTRHIDASTLAAALGLTPTQAASALLALERAGLVDASRARLTMLGLAAAVRLGPAAGGPRVDLGAAVAAGRRVPSTLPVAAKGGPGEAECVERAADAEGARGTALLLERPMRTSVLPS